MSGGHFGTDPSKAAEPMGPMDPQGRRGHVGRGRALAMAAFLLVTAAIVVAWTLLAGGGERLLVVAPPGISVQEGAEVVASGRIGRIRSGADAGDIEDVGEAPGQPALIASSVRPARDGDQAVAIAEVTGRAAVGDRVTVAGEVVERVDERLLVLEGD